MTLIANGCDGYKYKYIDIYIYIYIYSKLEYTAAFRECLWFVSFALLSNHKASVNLSISLPIYILTIYSYSSHHQTNTSSFSTN